MKYLYQTIAAFLFFSFVSCQKGENPYVSKDVIARLDSIRHPAIKNVAFIYNSEVYYLADFNGAAQKITSSGGIKKFVKMSHDHTRFAYQNGTTITVVDKSGTVLKSLSYADIRNFDWSFDDKTLYVVNGEQITFYGPAITTPAMTSYNGYYDFISAAISKNGDLVYILRKYHFDGSDEYMMVTRKAAGGDPVFYKAEDSLLPPMKNVCFAANGVDVVLTFAEPHSGDDFGGVAIFDNLEQYPVKTFRFNGVSTPTYNREVKYLLAGLEDNDPHTGHYIRALYLDTDVPNNDKILTAYPGVKYLDWK
ncbi:hypothetical protein [Mucilaginibacter sp.]|uniref:hypothetical protein n=1 Tax=Mucilaginibacter sp. TaxID=1882438 RepID=UPI0032677A48